MEKWLPFEGLGLVPLHGNQGTRAQGLHVSIQTRGCELRVLLGRRDPVRGCGAHETEAANIQVLVHYDGLQYGR